MCTLHYREPEQLALYVSKQGSVHHVCAGVGVEVQLLTTYMERERPHQHTERMGVFLFAGSPEIA